MRLRDLAGTVAMVFLAACDQGKAGGMPAPTDGCQAPAIEGPVASADSVAVGGVPRTYLLVVPAGAPRSKRALVLVFHGKGSNGSGMRGYVGAALEGAAAGQAVFVYPDGIDDGPGWPNVDGKDVAFVDALLAKLAGQLCYDRSRVFATGFSYGGFMSNTLGCARAGTIRGIAPVSGGGPWSTCNGNPVAAWIAHGSSDGTVSLSSGQGSLDHWRAQDGCTQATHATSPSPCVAYEGCGANPVVWCQFDGGHEVPSFAPPAIWSFFDELR